MTPEDRTRAFVTLEIRKPHTSLEAIVVTIAFVLAWAALLGGVALVFVPAALIAGGAGTLTSIYLYLSARSAREEAAD